MPLSELIAHLQALQTEHGDMPVAYSLYSVQCLLDLSDLHVAKYCLPRADGWVQAERPDMPSQKYLCLPGN